MASYCEIIRYMKWIHAVYVCIACVELFPNTVQEPTLIQTLGPIITFKGPELIGK